MSRPVRFVHAADLHLGARFHSVSADDRRVADALVGAVPAALNRIVDLCIAERVDFLVIAGDVYDSASPTVRSRLAFSGAMARLAAADIPAYLVSGNHDPDDGPSAGEPLPTCVTRFRNDAVERLEHRDVSGELVCALYGRSYPRSQVTEDYAAAFSRQLSDPLAIGVLHTNVGGRPEHEDYAPSTGAELAAAGMDYWALGHIHASGQAAPGAPAWYAGSPQGLQPNESGVHGCLLVTCASGAAATVEFRPTASVAWAHATADIGAACSVEDVRQAVDAACGAVLEETGGPASVRIELTGRSEVADQLSRPGALGDLLEAVRESWMERDPWVWVDRLDDRSHRAFDLDTYRDDDGFLGDLVRRADELLDGTLAAGELAALLDTVRANLPARPDVAAPASTLVERARNRCLDLLTDGDDR